MMKRWIALCLLLCFSLCGCGQGKEEQAENAFTAVGGESSAEQEEMLNLSMRVPETLNPLLNREETVDRVLKLMYLPLFAFDESGKAMPAVAKSWEMSADGRSLTVQLNPSVQWQNGGSVTADDVVYSLNVIRNAPEDAVYKKVLNYVSGCSKTGTHTVVFTFHDTFSSNLAALRFPIISAAYYAGQNDPKAEVNLKPMGNGPYALESYQQASELLLKASTTYSGEKAKIPQIRVKITAGEETDINAFEQGMTDVLVAEATEAGKYADEGAGMYQFSSNQYDFIAFNFREDLFLDKSLRQAVAYALPKASLMESVYLNYGVMTNTPIDPKSWLYEENVAPYEYNPTMAATFLKNSGWVDENKDGILEKTENGISRPLRATILVNSENTGRVQIASKLKEELTAIGFEITVEKQPFAVYQEKFINGDFDMIVGGWKCSEVTDLSPFFHTGGSFNYIGYSNPEMDQLLEAAYAAVGEGQTLLAYSSLQKKLAEELPYICIAYRNEAVFTSKHIGGTITPVQSNIFQGIEGWSYEKGE